MPRFVKNKLLAVFAATVRPRYDTFIRRAGTLFCASTLDDLMRDLVSAIQNEGRAVSASKGDFKELTGVLLEITNPRARLSRTEIRGKPFSCLGELCWYLSASNRLDFIEYYISEYKKSADGDRIVGGYGPRLFNWGGLNQFRVIVDLLRSRSTSRKAVIQLFDAHDLLREYNDVPCTCTLQFLVRENKLEMLTNMRSNDAYIGLPHDVFCFTMIQELLARTLSVELGTYKHCVGSMHLYETDMEAAKAFLAEGWQSTTPMPAMPQGDPWPSVEKLLQAEASLRLTGAFDGDVTSLDPYWCDMIRLLEAYRASRGRNRARIVELRSQMHSDNYAIFLTKISQGLE